MVDHSIIVLYHLYKIIRGDNLKKFVGLVTASILAFTMIATPAAQANEKSKEQITNVENYTIETLSDEVNEEGMYVETGYKNVNAITEVTKDGDRILTTMKSVEDYYDTNGNFLRSVVLENVAQNDYQTGKAKFKENKREAKSPLAQPEKANQSVVQKNLESLVAPLDINKSQFTEVKGLSYADIEQVKQVAKELQASIASTQTVSAQSVEMAGAFDSYYNHDLSNGNFIAQALSLVGHQYIKVTGTTYGSSKNATQMANFKSNIDQYERYVIDKMEYATWTEVAGWAGVVMGLATIVLGYGTGPVGWVAISLYYGGALATFAGLTSSIYATKSRLDLSKNAAQYLENARQTLFKYPSDWEVKSATLVSGF